MHYLEHNRFHFLMRIRDSLDARTDPSRSFSKLFNAYARAFNRLYQRTGALFQRSFGRRAIADDRYFARLVTYFHHNPQRHGFVADFRDWPYSSYHTLTSTSTTRVRRDIVLSWFGDAAGFIAAHDERSAELDDLFGEP
jgi:putative transposase